MTQHQSNRHQLDSLIQAIDEGTFHAVFVSYETRLFRDADAMQVNAFIRQCLEHDVYIVTPKSVYDFHSPSMVRMFRFLAQKAYQVLEDTLRVQER